MNLITVLFRAMLFTVITIVANPIQAGPSCDVRPNHPDCVGGDGDTGPVFKVTFSNIVTGTALHPGIFTTPGTLDGDESGLNANPNGPNEVRLQLNDGMSDNFLRVAFGIDEDGVSPADTCFGPKLPLSGSIHMADNVNSGGDPYRVGYIWVHAKTLENDDVQYAIDLFDFDPLGAWSGNFLPQEEKDTTAREVTHWEARVTKKKFKTGCITDGLIETSEGGIIVTIERVANNPWYE